MLGSENTVPELGLEHISGPLCGVLKELMRRIELRQRLETERYGLMSDEEFVAIAERTGMKI